MNKITVGISEEQHQYIDQIASQQNTSPEEILESKIAEWFQKSQSDFKQAAKYVLTKNSELYRRLA